MPVLANTSSLGNPAYFRRSNTLVTDDEVIVGERHFPMRDVLGAQVFDITAGNYLVDDAFKAKAMGISRWMSGIAALGLLSSLFLDRNMFPGGMICILSFMLLAITQFVSYWVTPGYRPWLRRHEYHITLHTSQGSEDVISAYEVPYLESIAKEINRRVTVLALLHEAASGA